MLPVLVVCLMPVQLTTDNISNYISCVYEKKKIEYVIDWYDTVEENFETEDIIKALGIIYCESRGKAGAIGKNKDSTYDVGLWQFNDNTWNWLVPKLKIKSKRTNPIVSTAVASWLVYNDGWYHWNSSKHCWKGTNNELLQIHKQ
tara:strand:- start:1554 stop:1988 length:435 start_codon:yes stop_codon:yes gene_type:complete